MTETTYRPLGELAIEQQTSFGSADFIGFRCPKPMGVTLRTQALIHKCEISSIVRVLIQEGLEARGINWLGV